MPGHLVAQSGRAQFEHVEQAQRFEDGQQRDQIALGRLSCFRGGVRVLQQLRVDEEGADRPLAQRESIPDDEILPVGQYILSLHERSFEGVVKMDSMLGSRALRVLRREANRYRVWAISPEGRAHGR